MLFLWDGIMKPIFKKINDRIIGIYGINANIIQWIRNSEFAQRILSIVPSFEEKLFLSLGTNSESLSIQASKEFIKELWDYYPQLGPYPFLETLSEFQFQRVFSSEYRDHVSHQLKVFLLGLYLYDNCNYIKKEINNGILNDNINPHSEFHIRWLATSVFHDTGYVMQNSAACNQNKEIWKHVIGELNELYKTPVSSVNYFKKFLSPEIEKRLCQSYHIPSREILDDRDIGRINDCDLLSVIEEFAVSSNLGSCTDTPIFRRYFDFAYSHDPIDEKISKFYDHGIVSAIFLMQTWLYFEERFNQLAVRAQKDKYIEDEFSDIIKISPKIDTCWPTIKAAAGAIALHNIDFSLWNHALISGYKFFPKKFKISLTKNKKTNSFADTSLAFLLKFSDTLQDWGRCKFREPRTTDYFLLQDQDLFIFSENDMIKLHFRNDGEIRFTRLLNTLYLSLDKTDISNILALLPKLPGKSNILHTTRSTRSKLLSTENPKKDFTSTPEIQKTEATEFMHISYDDHIPNLPNPYFSYNFESCSFFSGRFTERECLTKWLIGREGEYGTTPLLLIRSIAGMGKSILSWVWTRNDVCNLKEPYIDDKPLLYNLSAKVPLEFSLDGILWYNFSESKKTYHDFLVAAILYFSNKKVQINDYFKKGFLANPILDFDKIQNDLIEILNKKKFLLVFDGFEKLLKEYSSSGKEYINSPLLAENDSMLREAIDQNVDQFIVELSKSPKTKTLITSRILPYSLSFKPFSDKKIPGIPFLGGLSEQETLDYFYRRNVNGNPSKLLMAAKRCGFHPQTINNLIISCHEDLSNQSTITIPPNLSSIDFNVELTYSKRSTVLQNLLNALSCLRDNFSKKEISYIAHRIDGLSLDKIDAYLAELNCFALLKHPETNQFYIPAIVKDFCYNHFIDKRTFHSYFSDYFEKLPLPNKESIVSVKQVSPRIELFHHLIGCQNYIRAYDIYFDVLDEILFYKLEEYFICDSLLQSFFPPNMIEPTFIKDKLKQLAILDKISNIKSYIGEPDSAFQYSNIALDLINKIDRTNNFTENILCKALEVIAKTDINKGKLDEAKNKLKKSIEHSHFNNNLLQEISSQRELARLLSYTGSFEEAINNINFVIKNQIKSKLSKDETDRSFSTTFAYRAIIALLQRDVKLALINATLAKEKAEEISFKRDIILSEWVLATSQITLAEEDKNGGNTFLNNAFDLLIKLEKQCAEIEFREINIELLLTWAKWYYTKSQYLNNENANRYLSEAEEKAKQAIKYAELSDHKLLQSDINILFSKIACEKKDYNVALIHAQLAQKLSKCNKQESNYMTALLESETLIKKIEKNIQKNGKDASSKTGRMGSSTK